MIIIADVEYKGIQTERKTDSRCIPFRFNSPTNMKEEDYLCQKVLKFIVHLVVICTLVCVLGLVLPPFFGVRTVIVDKADEATNLPVGSVTYAIPEKSSAISVGTPILVQKDSKTYKYTITDLDASKGTGTVTDQSVSGGKTLTIKVGDYVPKVVITIGYVGYLLVATESIEGLIILGLVVLFLIILYVIAELWKKEPDDIQDDMEDPEPGYVKSKKELKREEKARARRMREEEKEILQEEKARKRKGKKAEKRKVRTGGFVDEIDEDDITEHSSEKKASAMQQTAQTAASEAHEELKKEIAAATSEEADMAPEFERTQRRPAERKTARPQPRRTEEPERVEEEQVTIGSLAMPSLSAAQLASRVKQAGDAPDIVKDDITNVTLFDYSDIIGSDTGATEE